MTAAKNGDTVHLHYVGKLEDGTVFDSSRERGPLRIVLGEGLSLWSLEEAVVGMSPGDARTVQIPARQAFGPYLKNMVRVLRRDLVPQAHPVKAGQRLRIRQQDGKDSIVRVTRVTETEIMVDMNHPLAGKNLTFEIELMKVSSRRA